MTETTLDLHLMHPGGESEPGDPNAAFHLDGLYHLHYILRHPWRDGHSYSFVHVTSPDLLHWTWQPTKLQPSFTGHGMFSGTGFLTEEGLPAIIYHGQGSGNNYITVARDRNLSAWDPPYPVEVRAPGAGTAAIANPWDPDCFRIGDTYYAISGGEHPPLFKSTDLRTWTWVGDFLQRELPGTVIGEDISCPNFFPIGDKWMLLCISHPYGCRSYLGEWDADAEQFVPEQHGRMNWRRDEQPLYGFLRRTDVFAPESVLTPDGRRVMWAWLTSIGAGGTWQARTVQSLPRELSLPADGILRIAPVRELERLRYEGVSFDDVTLAHPVTGMFGQVPPAEAPALQRLADLDGNAHEIRIVIPHREARRKLFGVVLFVGEDGAGLPVMLRPETGTVRVGTTDAPFAVSDLPDNEDVELRIFIDHLLVEVFVNHRQAVVAAHTHRPKGAGLHGFTVGAATTISRLDIWKLKPTNQGFLEARTTRVWEPDTQ